MSRTQLAFSKYKAKNAWSPKIINNVCDGKKIERPSLTKDHPASDRPIMVTLNFLPPEAKHSTVDSSESPLPAAEL